MSTNSIGIFDSGVGGLSVFKELIEKLPYENVIYYADSNNCPYGVKSKEQVIELSKRIVEFLEQKGCKLIVVACNTATAAAIDVLRDDYDIPFIGMEPAVKPAALNTTTNRIAVLATEGTFNGRLYNETKKKFANNVDVNITVGNDLVRIVENGEINEESSHTYINYLLSPLIKKNIDQLVLGCTHYPFLIPVLRKVLPESVNIIDPAPAVVDQTRRILEKNGIINKDNSEPKYSFYSSGKIEVLSRMVKRILEKHVVVEAV